MSSKASFCPHFSQRSRGGLRNRFDRSAVAFQKPSSPHSFQDGVIHVVIEGQWKSASQGRDSSRAINQWKKLDYKNILCLKNREKSEHFYVTHEKFWHFLAFFWQKKKHCFKHLMLFLRALSVRAQLVRKGPNKELINQETFVSLKQTTSTYTSSNM